MCLQKSQICSAKRLQWCIHGVTVHGLAHQDIVVVVVGRDLLDGAGGVGFELGDGVLVALLLQRLEDLLDVGYPTSISDRRAT